MQSAWVQVSRMKEEVPLPLPPKDHPPAFVLGGDKDLIVDAQALAESAGVYGMQPVILKNAAHDIMLVNSYSHVKCAESFMCSCALQHAPKRLLQCQISCLACMVQYQLS